MSGGRWVHGRWHDARMAADHDETAPPTAWGRVARGVAWGVVVGLIAWAMAR